MYLPVLSGPHTLTVFEVVAAVEAVWSVMVVPPEIVATLAATSELVTPTSRTFDESSGSIAPVPAEPDALLVTTVPAVTVVPLTVMATVF
jgi:hypothetical protein